TTPTARRQRGSSRRRTVDSCRRMVFTAPPMTARETMFRQMVTEFPDSPMGHFSLGKFLLEEKRWAEAAQSLGKATALDPGYAAAFVALGDAHAGAGEADKA